MLYIINYVMDMVNSIWSLDQIVVLKYQSHGKAFLLFRRKTMTPKVQVSI